MSFAKRHYPGNWTDLRRQVLERAGHRCEGSPRYPGCRAQNGLPHPETGSRVVLTTAHLFPEDTMTQDISRLRAWCQRCHLTYDAASHARKAQQTRRARRTVGNALLPFTEGVG